MNPAVFASFAPDAIALKLGTDHNRFLSRSGCDGLAKETEGGKRLDILFVGANREGTGQFKAFMLAAQAHYRTICVWEIWNGRLKAMLAKHGYTPETDFDGVTGEIISGMRWDQKGV